MQNYVGNIVKIETQSQNIIGKLCLVDEEKGKVVLTNKDAKEREISILEINHIDLADENSSDEQSAGAYGRPLEETQMHYLFYDAFNIYGPFEDSFIQTVAIALKKFVRNLKNSSVRIVIGSDDVFGRIGFCFACSLLERVCELSIEVDCELEDLRTMKYKQIYHRCGGEIQECRDPDRRAITLYACNRNYFRNLEETPTGTVLILDLLEKMPFSPFIGLGLGFVPEHYAQFSKGFYILDVGFSTMLADKYKVCKKFDSSLMKADLNKIRR